MTETFKNRDDHRGNPAPHLGQDHYEKSRIEAAAGPDTGPTFVAGSKAHYHEQQQQPADVTFRAQRDIEKGSGAYREQRSGALQEAVEELDNRRAVTPE